MITIRTTESTPIVIDVHLHSPSVYLDHCVISQLANDQKAGAEFARTLCNTNGTLCLSTVHLLETLGLGIGPTFSRIKTFLNSVGNRFVVIDFDPGNVIAKEREWKPTSPCPALDLDIVKEIVLEWDGISSLDFGILLTGLEQNPQLSQRYKDLQQAHKQDICDLLQTARREYKINSAVRLRVDDLNCPDPSIFGPTEYISCALRRECIRTNEEFNPTDGPDFFHSVVSTSYLDFVVLDKKWARRLNSIKLPQKSARVFSIVELNSFLRCFNNFHGGLANGST